MRKHVDADLAEDRAEMVIEQLEGVIAFPVTPFADDLSLDVAALRRNVQAILRHPVAAIVAAGGNRASVLADTVRTPGGRQRIVDEAKGRIPVIAAPGSALRSVFSSPSRRRVRARGASPALAALPAG